MCLFFETNFPGFENNLHVLQNGLLELAVNLLTSIVLGRLSVEGEEGTEVELGLLEELDLADVDLNAISMLSRRTGLNCQLTFWRG